MYAKLLSRLRHYRHNKLLAFTEFVIYSLSAKYFKAKRRDWKDMQLKYLSNTLNYAKKHTIYYKSLLSHINITPQNALEVLERLPLIDKKTIREEGRTLYSDRITDPWDNWANTGGSTGEPLRFPSHHTKLQFEGIHEMMLYQKMGISIMDIIVSIDGQRINEDKLSKHIYYNSMDSVMYGKAHFSTLYMSDENLKYYVEELNRMRPKILRGYPSGILDLCRFINENHIELSFQLKGLYLTSESFDDEDEKYIEQTLHCPVYGQYGQTEMCIFAIKEPHTTAYECSPLYGITEVIKDGKHVNIGEEGEIFVTSFCQRGLPFIRYATGDLAVYGGTKEDGTVILSSLKGRAKDYIINSEGKKIYLVGFIFGGHLEAFNYIRSWQLEQNEIGKVNLRIVKNKGYSIETEKKLKEIFLKEKIDITFTYVEKIKKTNSGKQLFLIQNYA